MSMCQIELKVHVNMYVCKTLMDFETLKSKIKDAFSLDLKEIFLLYLNLQTVTDYWKETYPTQISSQMYWYSFS